MDLITWFRMFRFELMAAATVGVVIGGIATFATRGALSSGTATGLIAAAIIIGAGVIVFYRVKQMRGR